MSDSGSGVFCQLQLLILVYLVSTPNTRFLLLTKSMQKRVLFWKKTCFRVFKKNPPPPKFITALTIAHHLSLSWARSNQSVPPHLTSWRSIHSFTLFSVYPYTGKVPRMWKLSNLILSSHLRLGLPGGFFTCYMSHPSHSSRFYHPHNIGWAVQIIM